MKKQNSKSLNLTKNSKELWHHTLLVFRAEEAKIVKQAVTKAEAQAAEAKPTLGDANDALQALKDKMDGKK